MKRAIVTLVLTLAAALLVAAPASAAFGFEDFSVRIEAPDGSAQTQAGSHPDSMITSFEVNSTVIPEGDICSDPFCEVPDGEAKDMDFDLPPGLIGEPGATPRCSTEDFAVLDTELVIPSCPDASAVGVVGVRAAFSPVPADEEGFAYFPVYNLAAPPGAVQRLGFIVLGVPVTVDVGLRSSPPYNAVARLRNIAQALLFYSSELTLWGNPASDSHDTLRGSCVDVQKIGELVSRGQCPVNFEERPLLTLPRSCGGPLLTTLLASSWQEPQSFVGGQAQSPGMSGCAKLAFGPQIAAQPTTREAESPMGLDFTLEVRDEGLTSPTGLAHSDIKEAVVTLPEGMTVNPSAASGLGVCSRAQYEAERLTAPGQGCPDSAKIGTIDVTTPLLGEPLSGALYQAQQDDPASAEPGAENPFDTLLALYVVIRSPRYGILVKQAGKVVPDPRTGQLVSTFADIPQLPFSKFELHFREGPRAPLVTPPACGTHTTRARLRPWADPADSIEATSSFEITSGPGGGPCPPPSSPPFEPGFQAGSIDNDAGSFSPFYMRLTRRDGDQDLTRFSAELPPGVVAKLAGTSQCADGALAAASAKSGRAELASPSCPAASQIGRVLAGAGVGPALTYVQGSLYLAGPYSGAPLSVAAIVPAVAGPFDVGTVITRVALRVDPRSAEVIVDGERSDPIPHILAGIPLRVRDIRVYVDRPQFTLNPTSCEQFAVAASLWGGGIDVFSSADDSPLALDSPYQATDCTSLGFKPRLALRLKGGTARGAHPALRGTYRPRPGDANLEQLVLRLPRSAFLDQAHIRTICTRVQFAQNACPEGAIYGKATAYSPLLEESLRGPVYLRSSSHNLPDFVADLHGLIDVEAVARIDSKNGGIRATFEDVPDAPLSKVVVEMRGAKKGLIVNSRNLCFRPARNRAASSLAAQNGRRHDTRPRVTSTGCRMGRKAKRGSR